MQSDAFSDHRSPFMHTKFSSTPVFTDPLVFALCIRHEAYLSSFLGAMQKGRFLLGHVE